MRGQRSFAYLACGLAASRIRSMEVSIPLFAFILPNKKRREACRLLSKAENQHGATGRSSHFYPSHFIITLLVLTPHPRSSTSPSVHINFDRHIWLFSPPAVSLQVWGVWTDLRETETMRERGCVHWKTKESNNYFHVYNTCPLAYYRCATGGGKALFSIPFYPLPPFF